MTTVVLDASIVAAWYLDGQATEGADALLQEAPRLQFDVPHIFPTEVVNLLLVAERRGRIAPHQSQEVLDSVAAFKIHVHEALEPGRMGTVLSLARAEMLTAYDALYLDLALREGATLASRDGALLQAAERRSTPIRDLRS